MPFVLDASIVHDWALGKGHPTAYAARELLQADRAVSPSLWWFEVRNGLVMAERRGRTTAEFSTSFLQRLALFPVTLDTAPDETAMLGLARRHRLTVYDAAYLELALREQIPLATLDHALAAAATAEDVPVLGQIGPP
jgi:predicted nucleic acid-binding protein